MSGSLNSVAEVADRIHRGEALMLAGDARLLERLPAGNWIGGTVPYLVDQETARADLVHVTPLAARGADASVRVYDVTSVRDVYADLADRGFGVIIIPASSPIHLEFALHAPGYRGFAVRPLVGWISGVPLDEPPERTPRVYSGTTRQVIEDGAVVMQVTLPEGRVADVAVVNIFEQGEGESIGFPQDGFNVTTAIIDGVETNFADFICTRGLDTRLPLVADYYGLMVNVSFRAVDPVTRTVQLYSPVFAGLTYRHACPVSNYSEEFRSRLPAGPCNDIVFSCNCILNYFYSEVPGQQAQSCCGPLTFGEVAYQLLNQTMVSLTVSNADRCVRDVAEGCAAEGGAAEGGATAGRVVAGRSTAGACRSATTGADRSGTDEVPRS